MTPDKKPPQPSPDQPPKESNEKKLEAVKGKIEKIREKESELKKEVKGLLNECDARFEAIKGMLGDKTLENKEVLNQLLEIDYDLDVIFREISREKTEFYRESINRAAVKAGGGGEKEEDQLRYVNKEWWQLSKTSKNLQSLALNTFQKDFFIDSEKGTIQIRDDEDKMIDDARSMELVETLSQESGLDRKKILDILQNQKNQIEDRARTEASQKGSWKKILAKGALYAGGAAAASLVLGTGGAAGVLNGAGLGATRVVDAWLGGEKINKDFVKAKKNIQGNLLDNLDRKNNDLWKSSLENFSIELAVAKQQQIDSSIKDKDAVKTALSEIIPKEKDNKPNPEFETVWNSFEALSKIEEKNSALEKKISEKGWARKMSQSLEDHLKKNCPDFSSYLFQKNPAREKTLTAAVFAGAGLLARAMPGVRTAMLSYSGWKLGGVAAEAVTGRLKHYEILRDVKADDFKEKEGEAQRELLARARIQLADQDYRKKNSTEYAKLLMKVQEITTKETMDKAEHAMEYANYLNETTEETLTKKKGLKEERKVAIYAGKVLGAATGALLGQWLDTHQKESAANKPKSDAEKNAEKLAKLRHEKIKHPPTVGGGEPPAVPGEPVVKAPEFVLAGGNEEVARGLATVHKGEGVEHAFRRQIEALANTDKGKEILANMDKGSWDGKEEHLNAFAGRYAHQIALEEGYVKGTTNVGVGAADKYQYVLDWKDGTPHVWTSEVDSENLTSHVKGELGQGEYKFHYEPTPKPVVTPEAQDLSYLDHVEKMDSALGPSWGDQNNIVTAKDLVSMDNVEIPRGAELFYDKNESAYYAKGEDGATHWLNNGDEQHSIDRPLLHVSNKLDYALSSDSRYKNVDLGMAQKIIANESGEYQITNSIAKERANFYSQGKEIDPSEVEGLLRSGHMGDEFINGHRNYLHLKNQSIIKEALKNLDSRFKMSAASYVKPEGKFLIWHGHLDGEKVKYLLNPNDNRLMAVYGKDEIKSSIKLGGKSLKQAFVELNKTVTKIE